MTANTLKAQKGRGWSHDVEANYVARTLTSPRPGRGGSYRLDDQENIVAAPLSHGSNPNSNTAGRRREDDENVVAFHMLQDPISENDQAPAWGKGNKGGTASIGIAHEAGVRRLTPTECSRLQGFPDDWLGAPNEPPDSPRYDALGDAVTVNVAHWIGARIMEAEYASVTRLPPLHDANERSQR